MSRNRQEKIYNKIIKPLFNPNLASVLLPLTITALAIYTPETFALNSSDQIAELKPLTEEVGKLTKVACYIIGTASAGIGTLWSVAAQSLKVAAGSGAVTILAFKAPVFFAQSMII